MSDERPGSSDDVDPTNQTPEVMEDSFVAQSPFSRADMTPEQAVARRAEVKAKLAQVLARGMVSERFRSLAAHLPEDRVAIWARSRPEDIAKYEALGAKVESAPNGQGGSGDSTIRIGDLLLMSIPRDVFEVLEEINSENTFNKLGQGRKEMKDNTPDAFGSGGSVTIIRERRR